MKNFKMLAKGISLVLMLSLVLSTAVFAETTTGTYNYSSTGTTKWTRATDTNFYMIEGLSGGEVATERASYSGSFRFKGKTRSPITAVYLHASGGVLMRMPFTEIDGLSDVTVDQITKVTLNLPFDFAKNDRLTGNAYNLLLTEVAESEADAIKYTDDTKTTNRSSFALYKEDGTDATTGATLYAPESYAPANLRNFMIDYWGSQKWTKNTITSIPRSANDVKVSVPAGISSGYILEKFGTDKFGLVNLGGSCETYSDTQGNNSYNGVNYTFDLTDMIKGGTLGVSADRYLLIQNPLNFYNDTSNWYSNPVDYIFFSPYGATSGVAPVLTVEYEAASGGTDGATQVETHHSLKNPSTQTVAIENGYGYQLNFDGELDEATVTKENILLTHDPAEGFETYGYDVALSDDKKSVYVTFPVEDGTVDNATINGASVRYYKWLTAGETYRITLTDGLTSGGNAVFAEDEVIDVTMASDVSYSIHTNDIRNSSTKWATNGNEGIVDVGATGTTAGSDVRAYIQFNNFTSSGFNTIGFVAVYDGNNNLVQIAVAESSSSRNMRSGALIPRMTLNKALASGDTIRSFVWISGSYNTIFDGVSYMNKVTVQ